MRNNVRWAILADPPRQFRNRTGKMVPEHRRLNRYPTMSLDEIKGLPAASAAGRTDAAWGFISVT